MSGDFMDYVLNAGRRFARQQEQRRLNALLEEATRKGSFFVPMTKSITFTETIPCEQP